MPPSRGSRSSAQRRDPATHLALRATVLAILILTVVSYLPVRNADYVQDDHLAVEENTVVARGDLSEIFSTHYWAGASGSDRTLYRPVTILSYAIERRLTGRPSTFVSHVANLVFHVAATFALLGLALRLGSGWFAAGSAALFFAVHPVHVEAVAGIVGRAEIQATLFSLLALWAYTRAGPWPRRPDPSVAVARAFAWISAGALFLALGSKEVAIVTPLLMVALDLLFRPPTAHARIRWLVDRAAALAPSVLAAVSFAILRIRALEMLTPALSPHPVDNPLVSLAAPERIATALGLVVRYARLFCFPVTLSADYSGPIVSIETSVLAPRAVAGSAILAMAILLAVLPALPLARRIDGNESSEHTSSRLAFSSLLALLPYLVIGNLLVPIGAILAERFLYFPSAGICLALGLVLGELAFRYPAFRHWRPEQRWTYAAAIAVVLVAAFSLQTYFRASLWRDDASVFGSVATTYSASPRAQFILGKLLVESLPPSAGPDDPRVREALHRFDRALEASPDYVPAWLESGVLLARTGHLVQGLTRLDRTLELAPDNPLAHLNRGIALQRLGRREEAERAVLKSLVFDPDSATAWAQLGNLRAEAGRPDEAVDAWTEAFRRGRTDLLPRIRAARGESG